MNGTDADAARMDLSRWGWLDVEAVADALRRWLRADDGPLQIEALRATEALRLADLAEDVESAIRYTERPEVWRAGRSAATRLGIAWSGIRPPRAALDLER